MRRTYITFLGAGALTLIGLGATVIVQGGWEAVAAAFAILQGLVFVSTFIALRVAAERPRSGRPGWAVARGEQRDLRATAERATANVRDGRVGVPRSHRTPAAVVGRSA